MLQDGFPQTNLTHENISTTEKERKKYANSNRVLQTKLTHGYLYKAKQVVHLQSHCSSWKDFKSLSCFFLFEILISVSFSSLQCRWECLLLFLSSCYNPGWRTSVKNCLFEKFLSLDSARTHISPGHMSNMLWLRRIPEFNLSKLNHKTPKSVNFSSSYIRHVRSLTCREVKRGIQLFKVEIQSAKVCQL